MSVKLFLIFILISVGIIAACFFIYKTNQSVILPQSTSSTTTPKNIREPIAAGKYYSNNQNELNNQINDFLSQAETTTTSGTPKMIIVPHAGYDYSGQVTAYAFKNLGENKYDRVILIGQSHNIQFDGVAADTHDSWNSPLGKIKVDQIFIEQLKKTSIVFSDKKPHTPEHSLEVIVPFIIKTLGSETKIVPLLFGNEQSESANALADILAKTIDNKTLIIISSDLSHYPTYEDANYLDNETIKAILTGDANKFQNKITELTELNRPQVATLACGQQPIASGLELVKKLNWNGQLLKYANSGDYAPDSKNQTVGYASIIFNDYNMINQTITAELNSNEQKLALDIARQSLVMAFNKQEYQPDIQKLPKIFNQQRGAFVTLKKDGQLRGCIGIFEPDIILADVIKNMALSSAFNDTRFEPLQINELNLITIEISVLSPMKQINNADSIEIGTHGVYIKKGRQSGVFLPQVATEMNWDKETFLNNLCVEKAGLPKNCWQDSSSEIYIFTAQVFAEK
ncbi:MAG: hypothetical protein COU29_03875 [Candidatus Magasanikbacteria bacterium CG10_big_fil_rev_8_21_14_0_10_36_32]|uniref:MEMO1 family protein COU29_03875 n=1 Tax=Candidatus Magasanikbacteria bacterium CG10_big_fil_rev_8_21_14_0_10_36_32 TaxID=1974646 RepID=A0A2M6W5P8_9BACT|nr:MAG: hypothetical protein COU29_03875 [Candidatus Magasanikbacteria bacterium CG10_big_fil_rev_8_21_14_0_10_36_32]